MSQGERFTGNDAFEGYAFDLIEEIAKILSKIIIIRFSPFPMVDNTYFFQNSTLHFVGSRTTSMVLKIKHLGNGTV